MMRHDKDGRQILGNNNNKNIITANDGEQTQKLEPKALVLSGPK
jgi:hypothetical protein